MRRGVVLFVTMVSVSCSPAFGVGQGESDSGRNGFAVVTYVADTVQEQQAEVLIRSLQKFAGPYSRCPVYVVVTDTTITPCSVLRSLAARIVPVQLDSLTGHYPLAVKAFAAAAVEEIVPSDVSTLAWFDPETIILGPLHDLDLGDTRDAALRPVFLVNKIGMKDDSGPDDYWTPILEKTRLSSSQLPLVTTVIDENIIRAYFNCEVFSVNPRHHVCEEWAAILGALIRDAAYQSRVCTTFVRRLFLHQAVLSAVIVARTHEGRWHPLPLTCGYPLHLHERMPGEKKIQRLELLSCAILENLWLSNPEWTKYAPADEPLRTWLQETGRIFEKRAN